jgi:hypothetical protein
VGFPSVKAISEIPSVFLACPFFEIFSRIFWIIGRLERIGDPP